MNKKIDNNILDLLSKFSRTSNVYENASNTDEAIVIANRYGIIKNQDKFFGKSFENNKDCSDNSNYSDHYFANANCNKKDNSTERFDELSNITYFSALDNKTNSLVLIALFSKDFAREKVVLESLKNIVNDNLLNIIDFNTMGNYQYVVYPYLDCNTQTLSDYLKSGKIFTVEQLRNCIIRDINNALHTLHNANLSFNRMYIDSILVSSDGSRAMLFNTDLCQTSRNNHLVGNICKNRSKANQIKTQSQGKIPTESNNEGSDYSLASIINNSPYYTKDEKILQSKFVATDYYYFGCIIYEIVTGKEFVPGKANFDYVNSQIPKDLLCLIEGLTYTSESPTSAGSNTSHHHRWGHTDVENWLNGISMQIPGHDNLYYIAIKNNDSFNGLVTCGNLVFGNQLLNLQLSNSDNLNESQSASSPLANFSYRFGDKVYTDLESLVRAMLKNKDDAIKELRRSFLSSYLEDKDKNLWKICRDGELDLRSCAKYEENEFFLRTMFWLAPNITQVYWNGHEHNNVAELFKYTLSCIENSIVEGYRTSCTDDQSNYYEDIFGFIDSYFKYAPISDDEKNKYYNALEKFKEAKQGAYDPLNYKFRHKIHIKCLYMSYLLNHEASYVYEKTVYGSLKEFFNYIRELYNTAPQKYKNLIDYNYKELQGIKILCRDIISDEDLELLEGCYYGLMLLKTQIFAKFSEFAKYCKELRASNTEDYNNFIKNNKTEIERFCIQYPQAVPHLKKLDYKSFFGYSPDFTYNHNANHENQSFYEIITFGNYWQNSNTDKEPIEWYVIRDYETLIYLDRNYDYIYLVSRRALTVQQFNDTNTATDWKSCTLRKWLNNEFINDAFSADEQELLCCIKHESPSIKSSDNSCYTEDKIFISGVGYKLSTVSRYDRTPCNFTKYALNDFTHKPGPAHFWTVSMNDPNTKVVANENGKYDENTESIAHTEYQGVRPVICIAKPKYLRDRY